MVGDSNQGQDSIRSERMGQALEEYYRRLRQAKVEPVAFAREFPDIFDELLDFLLEADDVNRLASASKSAYQQESARPPEAPARDEFETIVGDSATADAAVVGRKLRYFGDYELIAEIARGGMGIVYQARQSNLNRTVALKTILAGQFASQSDVKRFYLEAAAAAKLEHPGIVPIFEIGEHQGQHFFSMGFVKGKSLSALISDGPLPPRQAAGLLQQVSEAIAYAHARGVIHRDLKPANVLVDNQGRAHVTDFGLAKNLESESELTRSGSIMGTPSYMPPEQARGETAKVSASADVYSLGATLYCTLTGRPPFQAATIADTLRQVIDSEPVSPRSLNPQVPQDLETICLKCLEKEPARRYASAIHLQQELERVLRGEPILARPISATARAWRWCKRKPAMALSLAVIVLTVSLLAIGSTIAAVLINAQRNRAEILASDNEALAHEKQDLAASERAMREVAEDRKREVERQLLLSEAARIAGHSQIEQEERPVRATLLAMAALQTAAKVPHARVLPAEQQLRSALRNLGGRPCIGHEGAINAAFFTATKSQLITVGDDATVRLWDAAAADPSSTAKVLRGHRSPIRQAACSSNARWLFTESTDGELRAWDLQAKDPEASTRVLHTAHLKSLVANDRWLVALTADGLLLLWNVNEGFPGRAPRQFGPYSAQRHPTVVAVGPNHLAISAEADGIELWKLHFGVEEPTKELIRHPSPGVVAAHLTLALSPDGKWLASSDWTDIELWDLQGDDFLEPTHTLNSSATTTQLSFSEYGETLLQIGDLGALMAWSLKEGEIGEIGYWLRNPHMSATAGALSPEGNWIAVRGNHNTAYLWNTNALDPTYIDRSLRGHDQMLSAVSISRDSRWLATASYDGTARIWDLLRDDSFASATSLSANESVTLSSQLSRDGRWLFVNDWRSPIVKLWDLAAPDFATAGPKFINYTRDYPRTMTPDGQSFIGQGDASSLNIWDLHQENAEPRQLLPGLNHRVSIVAVSPDGRYLATSDGGGEGRVCDLQASDPGATVQTFRNPEHRPLHFSPNSHWLAIASAKKVQLLDLRSREKAARVFWLDVHQHNHYGSEVFTPDGHWLATASSEGHIKLWDLTAKDPSLAPRIVCQANRPTPLAMQFASLAVSANSRWLAAGSHGFVQLWDLSDEPGPLPRVSLRGDEQLFEQLAFSPDGGRLAAVSRHRYFDLESYATAARRLWLWDLQTPEGVPREEYHPLKEDVDQLYFSPDSRTLITTGSALRLWHLEISDLLPIALQVTGRELTAEEIRRYQLIVPADP